MKTDTDLQAAKSRVGKLVRLDYTSFDLPTAHLHLGKHVQHQVHKILTQRLDRMDSTRICELLDQARACRAGLAEKVEDKNLDARLRAATAEYLECLTAWTEGVGLGAFEHPALAAYQPLGRLDLALFLQHDSSGCQTGMYRRGDGSVILWHTEEDIEPEVGSGFDQLRIASFNVNNGNRPEHMHAFIYPDLLPGPAFGWRSDGYAQAADLLYIKSFPNQTEGTLANIITWLALRLGATFDTGEVINAMLPCFDGYALNNIYSDCEFVQAKKHEFGANRIFSSVLDKKTGSYLYQANIFSNIEDTITKELEDLLPDERREFEQRVGYTRQAMKKKDGNASEADDMRFFFNMITSQTGGMWAYANLHVKAYFICRQTVRGAEIWIGEGPPMPDDDFTVIKTSFDCS
jgi:hypothetical protein